MAAAVTAVLIQVTVFLELQTQAVAVVVPKEVHQVQMVVMAVQV